MILVFGKTGQVATELQRRAPGATYLGRDVADLADPEACARAIRSLSPSVVINAAAWTAVDDAEDHEAAAHVVNAEAPGAMARECAALDIPFLHVSTDYVFEGGGAAPWAPDALTGPLGAYGRTKLAGEELVRASGARHVILRTAWVFSAHGKNFVKTMLWLSETRDALTVVEDQHGGPTPAGDIAAALLTLAEAMTDGRQGGTYHYSGAPDTTWAGFAREIFAQAGRQVDVTGVPSSEYPTKATRPPNSRLDCTSLERDFGIVRPDWCAGVGTVLNELGAVG